MSDWATYNLVDPHLAPPLPVMRGLVSALCERREAIDSQFHSSCIASSAEKVYEKAWADVILGYTSLSPESTANDVMLRPVKQNYVGGESQWNPMEFFDVELETLVESGRFVDASSGGEPYSSLEQLASSAGYSALIQPETDKMRNALNARWAIQRRDMLKKLRYVYTEGNFAVEYRIAGNTTSPDSPQAAYNALSGWTTSSSFGYGPDCSEDYYYHQDGYWHFYQAAELVKIKPNFDVIGGSNYRDYVLPATEGIMTFEAGPIEAYGGGYENVFSPLCTTVSSGANTFVLSNGVFASWGYGSASALPATSQTQYMVGWEADNVQIIYDYNSVFNFKE